MKNIRTPQGEFFFDSHCILNVETYFKRCVLKFRNKFIATAVYNFRICTPHFQYTPFDYPRDLRSVSHSVTVNKYN